MDEPLLDGRFNCAKRIVGQLCPVGLKEKVLELIDCDNPDVRDAITSNKRSKV